MLSNWTKATTTTTGPGALTLAAVSGFPLPSGWFPVGALVPYSIITSDGKAESGIGTLGATNTLTRTRVNSTFDGTTANNTTATALTLAAGTHNVYIGPMTETLYGSSVFPPSGPTNSNVISLSHTNTQANVAIAAAAQRATAWPFLLGVGGIVTGLSGYVSVAQTGATVLLALYEAGPGGMPVRQIVKAATTVDASTTGFKSASAAANTYVPPGDYWIAACQTNSGTMPSFTGSIAAANPFGASANAIVYAVRSDATATDLTDPFPTASPAYIFTNNGLTPYLGLLMS
jgi:hypothetical protein